MPSAVSALRPLWRASARSASAQKSRAHSRAFAYTPPIKLHVRAILFELAMADAKVRCTHALTPAVTASHIQYDASRMVPDKRNANRHQGMIAADHDDRLLLFLL